jgi:hypothetical protein
LFDLSSEVSCAFLHRVISGQAAPPGFTVFLVGHYPDSGGVARNVAGNSIPHPEVHATGVAITHILPNYTDVSSRVSISPARVTKNVIMRCCDLSIEDERKIVT